MDINKLKKQMSAVNKVFESQPEKTWLQLELLNDWNLNTGVAAKFIIEYVKPIDKK